MSDFFKEYFGCNGPCPEADRLRNFQPPQYITDLTNEFIGCLPDPAPFPCSAITDCALDTYVTGGTLTQPTNSTNDGFINLLYNANISASTYSLPYTDTFTTGGTYDNSTALITFIKNDSSQYTVDLSTIDVNDTFVTGFTYNNENTFILSRNDGVDLSATINIMSGLTINGDLTVTGNTYLVNVTGTSFYTDYIDFNNALTPLPADLEGRIYWDEDNGTLTLGMHGGQVLQQIGLEEYYYVKNQSGATIQNGRVIRAAGTLGASGRILGEYMIADGTIPAKFTLGIATEDIVNGDDGYVTEFGLVRGIDATGTPYGQVWNDGDVLWVSPTTFGGLTNVEPQAPNLKIEMAIVIHATANGSIFVRPHRYPYLYDIQQVNYSAGTENNLDILQWNSSTLTWDKTNTPAFSGLTVYGDTFLQSTTASTLTLSSTPTENNTNTEILSRNSISGEVEYRDISTFGVNITVVTGTTYTATTTDNVIGVDTSVNPVTIYLPDSIISGKLGYRVKDIGPNSYVNPITIQAAGSDTILTTEVVSSFDLSTDGGAVVLINTASGVWWQM